MSKDLKYVIRIDRQAQKLNIDLNLLPFQRYEHIDLTSVPFNYSVVYPQLKFPDKCIYCNGPRDVFEEITVTGTKNYLEKQIYGMWEIAVPIMMVLHIPFCSLHKKHKNMSFFTRPISVSLLGLQETANVIVDLVIQIKNDQYREEFENENTFKWENNVDAGNIKRIYSFVASTIMLDPSVQMGKDMLQQIPPYVYQNLKETDSTFRKLYEKVQKENSPHVMGTGMANSPVDYPSAFLAWLKSKGVNIVDIAPLMKKQIFLFAGDATNPQDKKSYNWCMFIYFDTTERNSIDLETSMVKETSFNPFIFRNGQKAYTVEDLTRLCIQSPVDAIYHLVEGHFDSWLTYIGRKDLADLARNARETSGSDETRLGLFLNAIH